MSSLSSTQHKKSTPDIAQRVVPIEPSSESSVFTHPNDKIDPSIIKQLLQDIEDFCGGYRSFFTADPQKKTLSKLLDNCHKEGIAAYGPRGSDIRKQLQRRLYKWKEIFKEGSYADQILPKYGIVPSAVKKGKRTAATPPPPRTPHHEVSPSSALSVDSSNNKEEESSALVLVSPQRPREIFPALTIMSLPITKEGSKSDVYEGNRGRSVPFVLSEIGVSRIEEGSYALSLLHCSCYCTSISLFLASKRLTRLCRLSVLLPAPRAFPQMK